jgi:hypothetical protein
MKNCHNKNIFQLDTNCIEKDYIRFYKNSSDQKNTLNFDDSNCFTLFHEKLQIIFENIRV